MKKLIRFVPFIIIISLMSGCASFGQSLKSFLGGDTRTQKRTVASKEQVGEIQKKNYKRTDHKSIQEQSELGAESGSLWIERGQGAYLFTQNTNRLIGDLINIQIDGHPKKQIETKVAVIQDLIDRIREQKEKRVLASQAKAAPAGKGQAAAAPAPPPPPAPKKQDKFAVELVPSRITEILKDGSYIVEGDQPFMIGKREYKLVVKGIVRQEDFDDQGISAETLLDPKFDIVTSKRKGAL